MSAEIFINNLANILVSLAFVAAILIVILSYLYLRGKDHYYLSEHMGKGNVALKSSLSLSVTSLLLICMVLATVLVVIYGFKTIVWTVREQISPEAKQYRRKALYDSIVKNAHTIAAKIHMHELHPEHPTVAML